MTEDPVLLLESKAKIYMQKLAETESAGDSDIQQLFVGSVIFITGGTGFVGKQLLEKLFRACRGIEKIYVLCRCSKGKTLSERLALLLEDPVYDEAKKVNPDFHKRIFLLQGDMTELRLGLQSDDWKKLCDEVHFIFHVAATVRFNEPLKTAVVTNVRGTREVLTLAKECQKLRSIVYVSSAYAHVNRSVVAEKFYSSPVPPNTLIELVETMDDDRIEAICPAMIAGWPNTYTFSKLLAEDLVRTMGQGLPICIVRPAIVTPSYREPAPGWLDISSINGPSAMIIGIGLGVLRTIIMNKHAKNDVVPVDFTNNLTIAASWNTVQRHARGDTGIEIYTLSRKRNLHLMADTERFMRCKARNLMTPKAVWYCYCIPTSSLFLFKIYTVLFHYIPGLLVDAVLATLGYKLRLYRIYRKVYDASLLLVAFLCSSWTFHDNNTLTLFNSLSKKDQQIFAFDVKDINFNEFMTNWCIGVRRYIIKDNLQGTNVGIQRQKWFKVANAVIVVLYSFALWKLGLCFYYFVKWLFFLVI